MLIWWSSLPTQTKVECELQRPRCDVFTVEPVANHIKDADLTAWPTCLADAMATTTEDEHGSDEKKVMSLLLRVLSLILIQLQHPRTPATHLRLGVRLGSCAARLPQKLQGVCLHGPAIEGRLR